MIIDEDWFWRRIVAEPADASAKLVDADWLEGRSGLRSRLLRLAARVGKAE